jgi:hypothetical protein
MHAWGLRLRRAVSHSRFRTTHCCLPICLTPSATLNLAISELTTSGYPAYMCPFPTLQVRALLRHALTWVEVRMVRYSFPV